MPVTRNIEDVSFDDYMADEDFMADDYTAADGEMPAEEIPADVE